jgi:hypothetical protein
MLDQHEVDDEEPPHRIHIQYTETERQQIVDTVTAPMIASAERHEHSKALAAAILAELDASPYASRRAELQARLCTMAATDNDAVVEAINEHAAQLAEDAHEAQIRKAALKRNRVPGPLTREINVALPGAPKPPRLRKDRRDGWTFQEIAGGPPRRL